MAESGSPYAKCPRYWRGCFGCSWYLGAEHLFFCRAYNRKKFGSDVVEVEVETAMSGVPRKDDCWWAERVDRRKNAQGRKSG